MKNKVQNIVVHSTQTLPTELHHAFPFHYIIHRNGKISKGKPFEPDDVLIQIAYVGGINTEGELIDNRTTEQTVTLFNRLILLTEKFKKAKIIAADEQFGKMCYPGFDVKVWLKSYTPKSILTAA
jgi:hypothetical protein